MLHGGRGVNAGKACAHAQDGQQEARQLAALQLPLGEQRPSQRLEKIPQQPADAQHAQTQWRWCQGQW